MVAMEVARSAVIFLIRIRRLPLRSKIYWSEWPDSLYKPSTQNRLMRTNFLAARYGMARANSGSLTYERIFPVPSAGDPGRHGGSTEQLPDRGKCGIILSKDRGGHQNLNSVTIWLMNADPPAGNMMPRIRMIESRITMGAFMLSGVR